MISEPKPDPSALHRNGLASAFGIKSSVLLPEGCVVSRISDLGTVSFLSYRRRLLDAVAFSHKRKSL